MKTREALQCRGRIAFIVWMVFVLGGLALSRWTNDPMCRIASRNFVTGCLSSDVTGALSDYFPSLDFVRERSAVCRQRRQKSALMQLTIADRLRR